MQPRHVPLAISAPLVIAGYGWLYTSDLFWGSDAHPERAALAALFLAALCTTVFLLHGLLMAWAEERAGEAAAAAAQCPIVPAAAAGASGMGRRMTRMEHGRAPTALAVVAAAIDALEPRRRRALFLALAFASAGLRVLAVGLALFLAAVLLL